MRRALLFAALAMLAAAPAAHAASGPPDVRLRASTGSAPLNPWTYTWTREVESSDPLGPQCATVVADGFPGYGTKVRVPYAKARPMVIVSGAQKPRVRRFRAYAELDENGFPEGRGSRAAREMKPLGGDFDKPAAWAITFKVNVEKRRYFDLDLAFGDPDVQACTEGGSASYSFGIGRTARRR